MPLGQPYYPGYIDSRNIIKSGIGKGMDNLVYYLGPDPDPTYLSRHPGLWPRNIDPGFDIPNPNPGYDPDPGFDMDPSQLNQMLGIGQGPVWQNSPYMNHTRQFNNAPYYRPQGQADSPFMSLAMLFRKLGGRYNG